MTPSAQPIAYIEPTITTRIGYQLEYRSPEWWDGWRRLEVAWAQSGGRPLSPFWSDWIRHWGARRREVLRVGRRGGKSSMLEQIATVEALHSTATVPTGDAGVVPIVSVDRREASNRIRAVGLMLDCLGIHEERSRTKKSQGIKRKSYADRHVLESERFGTRIIQVYTASIAGVSGFTSICVLLDEVAKWKDTDTGSNPAAEVIASIAPTMATQPEAVMVLSSSPWSEVDAHAQAYDQGDTTSQRVSYAPSWIANPTLTEEGTRREEPDDQIWEREYKAIPMKDIASQWFDPRLVLEACV